MMAALVFVSSGMRIVIPIGTENAAIHLGNIFCLLSGFLLGGVSGGLSAGIGSALYDLTNPLYVAGSPITFITKFIMGYLCGVISNRNGQAAQSQKLNLLAAATGQIAYIILYLFKGFIRDLLNGTTWQAAGIVQLTKLPLSLTNAVIAIIFSIILVPVFLFAMKKSGFYRKLH